MNQNDLLEALNDGANYICDTMLDAEGKSRCEYNLTLGKWFDYEVPWHTGQAIYGLVEAWRVAGNEKYLKHAKRAGDWWVSLEIKDHPKLKGMVRATHGDTLGEYIVFATTTDGTPGLFQLYEATGDQRYADVPTGAGKWLLENMYVPEHGVCYDAVNPETGEVMKEWSPFWAEKKEQELFDTSRPNNEGSLFLDIFKYTGEERYREVFLALCDSLVEKQGEGGQWMDFMPNDKVTGAVHPRFNLWYAESLLDGYDFTGEERYLEAARKTLKTHAGFQQADGTIYYRNHLDGRINRNSICGSSISFASILWLRLLKAGAGDEFKDNIEMSAEWVVKNRYAPDHPDPNLAGAFLETRQRSKEGKIWLTMRDVATSFGLRFLAAYYAYSNSK